MRGPLAQLIRSGPGNHHEHIDDLLMKRKSQATSSELVRATTLVISVVLSCLVLNVPLRVLTYVVFFVLRGRQRGKQEERIGVQENALRRKSVYSRYHVDLLTTPLLADSKERNAHEQVRVTERLTRVCTLQSFSPLVQMCTDCSLSLPFHAEGGQDAVDDAYPLPRTGRHSERRSTTFEQSDTLS